MKTIEMRERADGRWFWSVTLSDGARLWRLAAGSAADPVEAACAATEAIAANDRAEAV